MSNPSLAARFSNPRSVQEWVSVTPDDEVEHDRVIGIYIGTAGDLQVSCRLQDGTLHSETFVDHPAGSWPYEIVVVGEATAASDLILLKA